MRVSIFCASSARVDAVYLEAAGNLGRILAENHIAANYGGGAVGLMGKIADTMMALGGSVKGIIPEFMVHQGWNHPGLKDLIIVKDMHERMQKVHEGVDAYIALPGGVGTFSELLETITLKQLGQIFQPIVIINTNHFFDPFLILVENMVNEHFIRPMHRDIWSVVTEPGKVLEAIRNAPAWDATRIRYAPI